MSDAHSPNQQFFVAGTAASSGTRRKEAKGARGVKLKRYAGCGTAAVGISHSVGANAKASVLLSVDELRVLAGHANELADLIEADSA